MKRKIALLLSFLMLLSMCGGLVGCSDSKPTGAQTDGDYVDLNILFVGYTIEDDYKYHQEVENAINEKLYKDLGFRCMCIPLPTSTSMRR